MLVETLHMGKYKYLIGTFDSEKEAEEFLTNIAKLFYPKAYIVKFRGDSILD
jgi:hypothetical protein